LLGNNIIQGWLSFEVLGDRGQARKSPKKPKKRPSGLRNPRERAKVEEERTKETVARLAEPAGTR